MFNVVDQKALSPKNFHLLENVKETTLPLTVTMRCYKRLFPKILNKHLLIENLIIPRVYPGSGSS